MHFGVEIVLIWGMFGYCLVIFKMVFGERGDRRGLQSMVGRPSTRLRRPWNRDPLMTGTVLTTFVVTFWFIVLIRHGHA